MKKNKQFIQDLRSMSAVELQKKLTELVVEREQARHKKADGKLTDLNLVKKLDDQIAAVKTIMKEVK